MHIDKRFPESVAKNLMYKEIYLIVKKNIKINIK